MKAANIQIGNTGCLHCNDISCAAQSLKDWELRLLGESCVENHIATGEVLLSEGSLCSHIIYLKSGLVKEYLKGGKKHEYIVQVIKPHSYLGLPSLFSDQINHYSYYSLTDVTLCFIKLEIFNQFVKTNSDFAYEILSAVSKDSLNNYHRFITQHQKKIYGKLADVLLYFSKKIFESTVFSLPLSRKEISYLIGTSRESVSRQLHAFERDGIIQMNGSVVEIFNLSRLEQISRYG